MFASFKNLGRILHKMYKKWLEFLRKIWRARQVWGRLGKLLSRYGVDPIILEKYYRAVVQAVLLFGSETWVLTAEIMQNIEGVHVVFLCQITGTKARRLGEENF